MRGSPRSPPVRVEPSGSRPSRRQRTPVRCESERSQLQNRETALSILRAKLFAQAKGASDDARNGNRRAQVGTGMRGDKTRTYRHTDGIVTDHITGKKASLDRILRGFLEDLA